MLGNVRKVVEQLLHFVSCSEIANASNRHSHQNLHLKPSMNNDSIRDSMANEHNFKRRKLIGALFGNLELIPFNPKLDPEPFTCYNCWSDEHLRRDCPEPVTHAYCRNCGRRDVEIQDCPRCAKAYCEFLNVWEGNEQEQRRLSAALYNSGQFSLEENLCPFESSRKKCKQRQDPETDVCCDFEVKKMSYEEYNSVKSLTSEKRIDVDECWTDSDITDEEIYESVYASLVNDNESIEKENCDDECHSEHYESVQGSFVVWTDKTSSAGECDDESDYVSTRAEFFRECDSVDSEEFEQKSNESSMLSFSNDYQELSESFQTARDAQLNELFTYMRNKKCQDQLATTAVVPECQLKTPVKSKSVYYIDEMDDDVNYDDVIVDENERSESLCSDDYAIQEFLDLLDGVKHLPIDVQNIAVLHFVSERKKQCYERMFDGQFS